MREHQIVITLKPEQFLEVQRLARAANAKSMGIFVRQKLLAALGIEGVLQAETTAHSAPDLQPVLTEVKRLHGELKLFVAESLSLYSGELGLVEPLPAADPDRMPESASEQTAEETTHSKFIHSDDDLEKAAERAFAISPRLGPIGQAGMVPADFAQKAERTPVDHSEHDSRVVPEHLKHEPHSRRENHRYTHGHVDVLDEPFLNNPPAGSTAFGAGDPLQKLLGDEPDDLAAAAQAALSADDYNPAKVVTEYLEEDDEEFEIPLSIAERRRLLEEQEAQAAAHAEDSDYVQRTEGGDSIASQPTPSEENAQPEPGSTEVTSATQADSSSSSNLKGSTGQPLGYPPLSGSPPPKRRQV